MRYVVALVAGALVFVYASIVVGFGSVAVVLEYFDLMNVTASGDLARAFASMALIAGIFGIVSTILITAAVAVVAYKYHEDRDDDVDDDPRRDVDEIRSKIDELTDAISDPANDFELLANRAALDALKWARGSDLPKVVSDLDAYDSRVEKGVDE